eukprot:1005830-Amphidinium_carterae.2
MLPHAHHLHSSHYFHSGNWNFEPFARQDTLLHPGFDGKESAPLYRLQQLNLSPGTVEVGVLLVSTLGCWQAVCRSE